MANDRSKIEWAFPRDDAGFSAVAKYKGCGPEGRVDLVPDNLLGCDIRIACKQHDYEYDTGTTWHDKKVADKNFLHNMTYLVNRYDGAVALKWCPWLRSKVVAIRRRRRLKLAKLYYVMVRDHGGPFYAKGKKL